MPERDVTPPLSDAPRISARDLLMGGNRLKLGVFAFNGLAAVGTTVPEQYELTWPNSLDVAVTADRLGLEAIVPYARFRALVSPDHRSGQVFENFTWAAAVAARTQRAAVMSTVHVTNVNPILAAKAMATIDHISNGRFGLNIVCGWSQAEAEMFGIPPLGHDERYAYADEWITIIKKLWTDPGEFDFEGRYFKIKGGQSQPKPIQKPYPVLMNAAVSDVGKDFIAKHCDMAFTLKEDVPELRAEVTRFREAVRNKSGREIAIWSHCALIMGDTDADAGKLAEYYIAHPDTAYINTYIDSQPRVLTDAQRAEVKRQFALGGNGIKFIGSVETIARRLTEMSEAGVDGVLLAFVDFQRGVRRFGTEVLPLLERAGLRAPATPFGELYP